MFKLALLGLSLFGVSHGLKAADHDLMRSFGACSFEDRDHDTVVDTDEDIDCVINALPE